jgi:hypothetical protein
MRRDDWDRKGPDLKAALGCKKLAIFAAVGFLAGLAVLASGVAAVSGWLT